VSIEEQTSTQLHAVEAQLKAIGDQMALLIRIEIAIAVVIVAWGVASLVLLAYWIVG
jgi:hypothetical protein